MGCSKGESFGIVAVVDVDVGEGKRGGTSDAPTHPKAAACLKTPAEGLQGSRSLFGWGDGSHGVVATPRGPSEPHRCTCGGGDPSNSERGGGGEEQGQVGKPPGTRLPRWAGKGGASPGPGLQPTRGRG
ncbi:hypothetical protein NDU88_001952 [Pleurodeles waltl]|uniref:Uncharacterized protein n=1 Tax=Pleurodeles waltl TaxID=8319 RepID=A0AAV7PA88_PLEWA|nr:hypothetical protein NDU88_001952 [Pleurodeles waltl]